MVFKIKHLSKPKLKNVVFIGGLPGIGNVGKIAVDFVIENLKAKKIVKIHSNSFPHSVFVNENNLVELPSIELYHKRIKDADFVFMSGDVQPIDESSCYEFCEQVLNILESYDCKEVVTLGGIGLNNIPKAPKVYVTGTDKKFVQTFKGTIREIYGVVGPIIGVSGVMLGVASMKNIPSAALLAQTFGHPAYLGIKGAREILQVLNMRYKLKLNIKQLNEEINEIEEDLRIKTQQLTDLKETEERRKGNRELTYFG